MNREEQFQDVRPLLFSLAYRMLGSRADAEDVVQDAYLRWLSVNDNEVRSPKSYLTTIVARLALDALKTAHRKRETYIGPWLPEPLVEPQGTQPIEMAESLSIAFLHVLESLSPAERVAFLLHEVFDADYSEIAATLETSEVNCRQLVTRARKHLQNGRPRFPVDRNQHHQVLSQFLTACATGDATALTDVLSEEVVLYSDGGGKVLSALNPIIGRDRVSRFLLGIARKGGAALDVRFVEVNGEPGVLLLAGTAPNTIVTVQLDQAGRIYRIFFVNNPEKLTAIS